MRPLVVLLTFLFAAPAGAEDKPSAKLDKPADAHRAALVKAGYTAVPMTLDAQWLSLSVNGSVGQERASFLISGGTPDTVLDMKLAKRLNLPLGPEVAFGAGNGFAQLAARQMFAPGFTLGSYDTRKDWPNQPGVVADLSGQPGSPQGMLGNDFLDAWGVVIDFQSLTLYLRPPLAPMWPLLAGVWQVTSWQEEGEARKLDPKAPPKFTFADRRLKVVMDGQTREYAIRFKPDDRGDMILMIDPKQDGKPFTEADIQGGGLIKVKDGRMTLCALSQSGQARDLPEAFAAPKGSGYALIELKRTTPGPDKPSADLLHELLVKEGYKPVRLDREPDGNRMVAARIGKDDLRLMLRTGQTTSVFDTAGLDKWGAVRLGWMKVDGLGDNVSAETLRLRGMTLGEYDTRQVWAVLNGHAINIAGLNVLLARQKRKPIQGMLGNYDLLNGSAVIDYVTNTLYLRPVKKAVEPLLKGKWVGVAWEFDGNKGKYAPGDANVEFKNGRIRFATKNGAAESTFHVRDMGDRYMLGLFEPGANELADGFTYTSTGALRLTDGKLTLVMQKGPLRKEPISFAATKGSGLLLVEYERAK